MAKGLDCVQLRAYGLGTRLAACELSEWLSDGGLV